MSLFDELIAEGLLPEDFEKQGGILLQNDGDGQGDFIAKWDSEKAIPKDYKVGK